MHSADTGTVVHCITIASSEQEAAFTLVSTPEFAARCLLSLTQALDLTMPHPKKIVLHCRTGYSPRLDTLVEEFIRDGVIFVGVVGADCAKVEDIIDEIVVGDGSRDHHMLTSSHADESVEEAVRFAGSLTGEYEGEAHVIEV